MRKIQTFQVTLPGEGKDRVFRVTVKWLAQVSLFALEEALEGRTRQIPYDAILVSDGARGIAVWNFKITFKPWPRIASGTGCGYETSTEHDLHARRSEFLF